jgi:peroxiredoxin
MKSIIFSLFLILSCLSFAYSQQVEIYTKVGQQAPTFTITDINGKEFNSAEFKGKVVFVVFWATWCPYCREEMPHLENEIWRKYKSEDFVMLAIAREQTNEEISSFRERNKIIWQPRSSAKLYN